MINTGRLTASMGVRTRELVFGGRTASGVSDELEPTSRIDLAHVVMLAESGLLDRPAAARLLTAILRLRADDFAPVEGLPIPRGLYLGYETYLAELLGPDVGGKLHTARSRNDLKATATAMRLRDWVLRFTAETSRLVTILLARARVHQRVVMPVYTHFQAAMPITYGYYLVGLALALGRELSALRHAAEGLSRCPLGACAVAGTDLRIQPERTAELLGFDGPPIHAVDAVASRDVPLRILAAVSGVGLTLSRLGTDLQLWSTAEFGFVEFPHRLVGVSSAMPQKRNPFLLEHVKAKAGQAIGAWTAATSSVKSTPFTNTIEVGTEATTAIWPGLEAVEETVLLSQVLVSGARPRPERMRDRCADGFVTATSAANRLVRDGVPFRTAHHVVGDAVRRNLEAGMRELSVEGLEERSIESATVELEHGGGPGAFPEAFDAAYAALGEHTAWLRRRRERQHRAELALQASVSALTGGAQT